MFVRTLLFLALVAYVQCKLLEQCDSDKYGYTHGYRKTLAPVKVPHSYTTKVKVNLDEKDPCPFLTYHVGTSVKVCLLGYDETPSVKLVNLKTAYVYQDLFGKTATLQFTVYCEKNL